MTNDYNNTVDRLKGNGSRQHTYSVGNYPQGILFDGTSIWVSNEDDNTVSKITQTH